MSAKTVCSATELLLSRPSAFGLETGAYPDLGTYEPGPETIEFVQTCRVLVVGAGGLGCEALKNLALSGMTQIDLIDMDTIDVTNLNRQFLFREGDVGGNKADVAAKFIMARCPQVSVTAHCDRVQSFAPDFYAQFTVVLGCLDNIEARMFINEMLHDIALETGQVIPFVDGGSERFQGQARFILLGQSACYACTLGTLPKQIVFQLCTVAETPRKPEHCIAYALMAVEKQLSEEGQDSSAIRLGFEQRFGGGGGSEAKLDKDNAEHMLFLFEEATKRAERFHIQGVTLQLTSGVAKNIVPAIASTNAIVAAACVNELWKYCSFGSRVVHDYCLFNGGQGMSSTTMQNEKVADCPVCSREQVVKVVETRRDDSVDALVHTVRARFGTTDKISVFTSTNRAIYLQGKANDKLRAANAQLPQRDFFEHNDVVTVLDHGKDEQHEFKLCFMD